MSAMKKTRKQAKYSVLRIKLSSSSPTRFLWVKPHLEEHGDVETTLFIAGIPLQLTASRLENALLPKFGPVERCVVHRSKTSAIAQFEDGASVAKLLKFAASKRVLQVPEEDEEEGASYGLKAWVDAHKAERPGQGKLQEQLDSWTEAFEMEEERMRREREALMEEDGWTVVKTHKGRKKNKDAGSGTTVGAVTAGAALALKAKHDAKKDKFSTDFYRFQRREKKRNELLDLRKKFEEDKRRIQDLKAARKFKPTGSKFVDDQ